MHDDVKSGRADLNPTDRPARRTTPPPSGAVVYIQDRATCTCDRHRSARGESLGPRAQPNPPLIQPGVSPGTNFGFQRLALQSSTKQTQSTTYFCDSFGSNRSICSFCLGLHPQHLIKTGTITDTYFFRFGADLCLREFLLQEPIQDKTVFHIEAFLRGSCTF